jgi:uncharacterized protein YdcH (DUF465 family)
MIASTPIRHEIAQTDKKIRELEGEIRNLKAKRVRLKQELALPKN